MTIEPADPEIDSIRVIIDRLAPLDDMSRRRVLDYVMQRLGISTIRTSGFPTPGAAVTPSTAATEGIRELQRTGGGHADIKEFKETKGPKSGIEMVAVLAYYLAHEVRAEERRPEIDSTDITTYFPQADFPLPAKPRQCLVDAKNKGWLQKGSGAGKYKLTPVGQNLVRHNMPTQPA